MHKNLFTLMLSIIVIFVSVSISYSQYFITQLTNNPYEDSNPQVNDKGHVVWTGRVGSGRYDWNEIFLYDGVSIIRLTDNSYPDSNPRINNNGQVVWVGGLPDGGREIFLYDGVSIQQITNNSYDDHSPQINDNGYIVWFGQPYGIGTAHEIFLYDGMTITQLTSNSYHDEYPQINSKGYVVWFGQPDGNGSDYEIFLYDGMSINQLTENSYSDYYPQINDNGYVVWSGCTAPPNKCNIFLYDGTNIINLTNNSESNWDPQISNSGYIAWEVISDYTGSEIFLYNGTRIQQITNNSEQDDFPRINDKGHVAWRHCGQSDCDIFLYDGISITEFTNKFYSDEWPQISAGIVVWHGCDSSDCEIFLATPASNISVLPTIFDFGSFNVGTSSTPQIFTISNTGIADLHISDISLSDTTNYILNTNGGSNPCESTTSTITPDGSCTVSVTFNPSSRGQKDATLTINSDDPDTLLFDVSLTGTGVSYTSVTLLAPNGVEIIPSGSSYPIRWIAPAEAVKFKLMYSLDNGLTWFPIPKTAEFIRDTSYDWTVPKPWGNHKKCLVKVIGYKANGVKVGADKSNAPFTIEVVKLKSPDGGGMLTSGNTHTITWTTNTTKGDVAKVKLYYTKNGEVTWNPICDPITGKCALSGNPGSYNWTVPPVVNLKENCKVKVELKDADGNILGRDGSDSYFTIQP